MSFGFQLLCWRRHRGLTQVALADKVGILRPYLSRLESDKADPSLSLVRRLATALDLRVGELVDNTPPVQSHTNEELDRAARGALQPGMYAGAQAAPYVRPLSRLLQERRASLGLYRPRRRSGAAKARAAGVATLRRIKAELGESQWQALLKRIDKHATYLAPRNHEDQ